MQNHYLFIVMAHPLCDCYIYCVMCSIYCSYFEVKSDIYVILTTTSPLRVHAHPSFMELREMYVAQIVFFGRHIGLRAARTEYFDSEILT